MATQASTDGDQVVAQLRQEIEKTPAEYLPNLLQIVRSFRESVTTTPDTRPILTARALAQSDLVGMWQDRDDIEDSRIFARTLREQAQRRR
jgi:hypothetical protein